MNYKMIAMKISLPLMLAGVMLGNGAWAEESTYFECTIDNPGDINRGLKKSFDFSSLKIEGDQYVGSQRRDSPSVDKFVIDNVRINRATGQFVEQITWYWLSTGELLKPELQSVLGHTYIGPCEKKQRNLKF